MEYSSKKFNILFIMKEGNRQQYLSQLVDIIQNIIYSIENVEMMFQVIDDENFNELIHIKEKNDPDLIIYDFDDNNKDSFNHKIERIINLFYRNIIIISKAPMDAEIKSSIYMAPFINFSNMEKLRFELQRYIPKICHKFFRNKKKDRDILKDTFKAESLLKEKEKRIKELEKKSQNTKLENEKAIEERKLLKNEAKKLKDKIAFLEEEKQKETDNIEKIIKFLAAMPKEISDEQKYLENRRKRFTFLGGLSFSLGVISIFILIINILLTKLPNINGASAYLAYIFPIVFPMVISFLFYRQANMKSKEIEKINEKSILVQQVENALNSYNVLLSGDELKDKTILSIDRVINKIFDNNQKEVSSDKAEESTMSTSDIQKVVKMVMDLTKT